MTLDWTSLTIAATADPASTLTMEWRNQSSTVNGYKATAISANDWVTPLSVDLGTADSFSTSDIGFGSLHSLSQDSDVQSDSSAGVWTLRQGQFRVAGNGSFSMTIDYAWHASLTPSADTDSSFSHAFMSLGAETHNDPFHGQNRSGYAQIDEQLLGSFQSDAGSFEGAGTLSIQFPARDGDIFYFTVQAGAFDNLAAVPEPATAWLMASGLLGVLVASTATSFSAAGIRADPD